MSFSKTVSVFAALASIFAAGAAGYKLSQDNQQPNVYEERIKQLEEQLKQQPIQQPTTTIPVPVNLPQVPQTTQLPLPPPPVPPEQVSQSTP